MKNSFASFSDNFTGKVFIILSVDDKISNEEVIDEIKQEIVRLQNL